LKENPKTSTQINAIPNQSALPLSNPRNNTITLRRHITVTRMVFIFMPQMSRAFGDGVVVQVRIEQVSLTFTAEHSPAHAPLCRERQFW
jgi:hypothetical protein